MYRSISSNHSNQWSVSKRHITEALKLGARSSQQLRRHRRQRREFTIIKASRISPARLTTATAALPSASIPARQSRGGTSLTPTAGSRRGYSELCGPTQEAGAPANPSRSGRKDPDCKYRPPTMSGGAVNVAEYDSYDEGRWNHGRQAASLSPLVPERLASPATPPSKTVARCSGRSPRPTRKGTSIPVTSGSDGQWGRVSLHRRKPCSLESIPARPAGDAARVEHFDEIVTLQPRCDGRVRSSFSAAARQLISPRRKARRRTFESAAQCVRPRPCRSAEASRDDLGFDIIRRQRRRFFANYTLARWGSRSKPSTSTTGNHELVQEGAGRAAVTWYTAFLAGDVGFLYHNKYELMIP